MVGTAEMRALLLLLCEKAALKPLSFRIQLLYRNNT